MLHLPNQGTEAPALWCERRDGQAVLADRLLPCVDRRARADRGRHVGVSRLFDLDDDHVVEGAARAVVAQDDVPVNREALVQGRADERSARELGPDLRHEALDWERPKRDVLVDEGLRRLVERGVEKAAWRSRLRRAPVALLELDLEEAQLALEMV